MSKLISWVEIPATDIERAARFYGKVLNIEFQVMDFGKEKMACFPNGEGAISQAPDFTPATNGVLVSLHTEKGLNTALAIVTENGGKIVQSKTKIDAEGRGYFALIIDTEGNKVGLYEN
ncbi:VOC family protein [Carboxylicivirga marina]|uniref:VOC family protein n=1 Tax=Carboxylicivirga marina TaxID=2800988 RepID=UPI0025971257|nr:VOC family protein [uncultured Carboxylicivirga sp.]